MSQYEVKSVCQMVREMEANDKSGYTLSSKYVEENMREDIDKTEAYYNSKHTTGDTDAMGREKPFMNICYPATNIWYRATDLDRKNIKFIADGQKQVIPALIASIMLQEWMNKENFGQFLNDWGLTLAKHGSAVSKFIEKDGELSSRVMDWNNIIVDPIDFEGNIKIEKLWFTPAQLKQQKGYDQEIVDKLLDNLSTRETLGGQKKDNKANYIPIYEVHGELPLSFLTDKEDDEDTYVQQMHVLTFQEKSDVKDEFDEYTLYSGREKKDPYMITHLLKKEGVTYSGGAVKNLFEAQWMINHSQKQIKDQLDLASKIIFQTSDTSFAGNNVLTNIENGDILNHKKDEALTQLNNQPNIVAMQANENDWKSVANSVNGIADSATQEPKAGTAWRSLQAQLQEFHSLFNLMAQNKGLSLEQMLRVQIIPFFQKQLNNSDEIGGMLTDHQVKEFDSMYISSEASRRTNKKIIDTVLSGNIYDTAQQPQDMADSTSEVQSELKGNQRFIQPNEVDWATELKDFNWDSLVVDITGESKDIQGDLATLTSVFQTMVSLNGQPMSDDMRIVFNEILKKSGTLSPLEFSTKPVQQSIQQPALVGAGQVNQSQPAQAAMAGG